MEVCATSLHCPGDPTRRSRGVNSRAGGQARLASIVSWDVSYTSNVAGG